MCSNHKFPLLLLCLILSSFLLFQLKFVKQIPDSQSISSVQQALSPLVIQAESPLFLPTATPTIGMTTVQSTTIPEVQPTEEWKLNLFPWQAIEIQSQGSLLQVSNTPFGTAQVRWSPRFNQLWVDAVTAYDQKGNIYQSTGLLAGRYINTNSWLHGNDSSDRCRTPMEWTDYGQSLLFLKGNTLWSGTYKGYNLHEIDLNDYSQHALSIEISPNGSLAAILVEKDTPTSPQFDLLLLDVKTNTVLTLIENVGYGSLGWSVNNEMFAYWGRVNRTEYSAFGAMRLSIFTVSTNILIQKDLTSLVGADPCPQKPAWIENNTHLLLVASSAQSPVITDIEGNLIQFQDYMMDLFRVNVPRDSVPRLADSCPKVLASPSGQYLLISPTRTDIVVIDLIHTSITNQFGGFLCNVGTNISWSHKQDQFVKWGANEPLLFINPNQSGGRILDTDGAFPAWSPGGRLAYWKELEGRYALWMFDSKDGQPHQLADTTWQSPANATLPFSFDMTPKWSPNGRSIAFVASQYNKPETYLIEYLPAESKDFWLTCDRNGLLNHCVDDQLGIELEYPIRFGRLLATLSGGMCGGFAYQYNYGLGGGLSWDFCQPMDGGLYNFSGFSRPQEKVTDRIEPCSYFSYSTNCEVLSNGVVLVTQIPPIDSVCSEAYPGLIRGPMMIIAFELPPDRIIQGYMFAFEFLSTKAQDQLLGRLATYPPDTKDCQSSDLRQAYQIAAQQLQMQLQSNTTDEETSYKVEQIRRMAESITIH